MAEPISMGAAMIISSIIGGVAQGAMSASQAKEQARLEARRLGLDEKQIDFMIDQALRQNRVAEHNVGQISPMLTGMLGQQEEIMGQSPEYTRLEPPQVNNPYGAGGKFGNEAPPPIMGMPRLDYSQFGGGDGGAGAFQEALAGAQAPQESPLAGPQGPGFPPRAGGGSGADLARLLFNQKKGGRG